MPVHFSLSTSLKYWRITLRTVEESSLSRASGSTRLLCLGCKRDLFFFCVFELAGVREQPVEEFLHGGELRLRGIERVHAGAEHGGVSEPLGVPTDVLASHPCAALVAVEGVKVVQVADQDVADLLHGGRSQLHPGLQEILDLAEDPGTPLGRAPDHDGILAVVLQQ